MSPQMLDYDALQMLVCHFMVGALLISHVCGSSCDGDTSCVGPSCRHLRWSCRSRCLRTRSSSASLLVVVVTPPISSVVPVASPGSRIVMKLRYTAMVLVAISLVDAWATQEDGSMSVVFSVLASLTLLAEILVHVLLLGICNCWAPTVDPEGDRGSSVSNAPVADPGRAGLPIAPTPAIRDAPRTFAASLCFRPVCLGTSSTPRSVAHTGVPLFGDAAASRCDNSTLFSDATISSATRYAPTGPRDADAVSIH